jgi:predicted deacylase
MRRIVATTGKTPQGQPLTPSTEGRRTMIVNKAQPSPVQPTPQVPFSAISDEQLIDLVRGLRSNDLRALLGPVDLVDFDDPWSLIDEKLMVKSTVPGSPGVLEIREILKAAFAKGGLDPALLVELARRPEPADTSGKWHLRREGGLYNNTLARAEELTRRFGSFIRFENLPDSSASSAEQGTNRDIFALHVTSPKPAPGGGEKKAVYLQGAIHGDEIAMPEHMLNIVQWLGEQYGKDPKVTAMMDKLELVIVPVANPDGLDAQTRVNGRQVDLNRHMDALHFGAPHPTGGNEGSSPNPGAWNYRGPSARSEYEAKAIDKLLRSLRPTLFLDFHSYGKDVLYPWAYTNQQADVRIKKLGEKLAGASSYDPMQTFDYGHAPGDVTDYAWAELGIPAYCIEIAFESVPTYAERDKSFVEEVLPLMEYVGAIGEDPLKAATQPGLPSNPYDIYNPEDEHEVDTTR